MANAQTGWRRVMLGSPQTTPDPEVEAPTDSETTTLDPGCEIEGTLTLDRSICVEGEFRGALRSAETVTVGPDAAVQASIEARSVEIQGAVVGDVTASREVVIYAGARLHGNIDTPSLVIERGAFFKGETRMYSPQAELRAPARAAATPQVPPQSPPTSPT